MKDKEITIKILGELQDWIHSYNKDTNTHMVLLGKYPNIRNFIEKALALQSEKHKDELQKYKEQRLLLLKQMKAPDDLWIITLKGLKSHSKSPKVNKK